jgi:hypothetical protein
MSLTPETTVEYNFASDAYLHYCEAHECLRVADRSGDSVILNNITVEQIDAFIKYYNKYVKEEETANVED